MARGGRRQGRVGAAYANRTDLQSAQRPLPPTAVPNQPYGEAGKQLAAQKIVPMGGQTVVTAAPVGTVSPGPDTQPPGPGPGDLPHLLNPTTRPDEPVTHGLAVGAGGGPEVLPQPVQQQYTSARDLLAALAANTGSPALNSLAAYVRNGL